MQIQNIAILFSARLCGSIQLSLEVKKKYFFNIINRKNISRYDVFFFFFIRLKKDDIGNYIDRKKIKHKHREIEREKVRGGGNKHTVVYLNYYLKLPPGHLWWCNG